MGLISPFTLIRFISFVHLTAAYILLVDPRAIAEQNLVFILGEACKIPDAIHFTKPNEVTAFSAVILTFLAFSDLISTSLPTRSALEYWTTTTPLRLFFLFILTAWIYLTSTSPDESILKTFKASTTGTSSPFDLLKNSLVFAFGFIEVCSWMWVFTLLREARKEFLVEEAKQKQLKEEMEKESEMFGFGRANRRED